jgi:formylglycine-generating enzyme required for sulfatase activity
MMMVMKTPVVTPVRFFLVSANYLSVSTSIRSIGIDGSKAYPNDDQVDPAGAAQSALRVLQGGGWYCEPGFCRSACRYKYDPDLRNYFIGFRVVVVSLSQAP